MPLPKVFTSNRTRYTSTPLMKWNSRDLPIFPNTWSRANFSPAERRVFSSLLPQALLNRLCAVTELSSCCSPRRAPKVKAPPRFRVYIHRLWSREAICIRLDARALFFTRAVRDDLLFSLVERTLPDYCNDAFAYRCARSYICIMCGKIVEIYSGMVAMRNSSNINNQCQVYLILYSSRCRNTSI